ncbi:glycosyltransferase family 2 protein [Kocuria flava]|uniref:glycosyltransferase family 2 protein n=1 Tax=Kocuria flava TaxID=446860 RepID=UPI0035679379
MPVLNAEQFLHESMSSTMRTLPRDAELRLLDDGSTDSTLRILEDWASKDARIRLHRHETPQGVHVSLNELAQAGDSEVIGRMDADDICLPGRWTRGLRATRTADMAFSTVLRINEQGWPIGADQPGPLSAQAVPWHLLLGCAVVHGTVTMRRKHFETLGGYENTGAEDYELWLRSASRGGRIVRSAVPTVAYRSHSHQTTHRRPWENDETPVLEESYTALAEKLLGPGDKDERRRQLSAVTHRGPISPNTRAAVARLLDEVHEESQNLPVLDRVLLEWRIRRERFRLAHRPVD